MEEQTMAIIDNLLAVVSGQQRIIRGLQHEIDTRYTDAEIQSIIVTKNDIIENLQDQVQRYACEILDLKDTVERLALENRNLNSGINMYIRIINRLSLEKKT